VCLEGTLGVFTWPITSVPQFGPCPRRRREFIAALDAVATGPLAAHAQQGDRIRRIGWLMALDENDPGAKRQISALTRALADLGWTDGRNVRVDLRWYGGDINRIRALAQELVALHLRCARPPGERPLPQSDAGIHGGASGSKPGIEWVQTPERSGMDALLGRNVGRIAVLG
jgi:hypothetical protein